MGEQKSKITIEALQWAQLERMKFIEQSLLWSRKVSISALCKAFDITRQQAHKDITIYRELAPANIKKPEVGQKSYKATDSFAPLIINQEIVKFIAAGGDKNIDFVKATIIPSLSGLVLDGLIPKILSAIARGDDIEAIYASKTYPTGLKRTLHPVCLVYTINRLHLRAYCRERRMYRDYVLSRFLTLPKIKKSFDTPIDDEMAKKVNIRLIVNPNLNRDQSALINKEYGLIDGHYEVEIEKCFVNYFFRENNIPATKEQLEESETNPWSFPIVPNQDAKIFTY